MGVGIAAWAATLIVVILVVPIAIALLQRTLGAAQSIERRLQDTERVAQSIVGHTAVAPALVDTANHVKTLRATGEEVEKLGAGLVELLAQRAGVEA